MDMFETNNEHNEHQEWFFNGRRIRTVRIYGELWWVLKDICEALELSNSRMIADRLDEDDVSLTYIIDSLGRQQQIGIINESGIYNVILLSRKPEAKKFKSWVTHEVLPSIRQHGAYITPVKAEEILNNPDALIEMLNAIKKERAEKERLQFQKEQLKVQIEEYKPKAVLADAISVTKDTILIRDLAKILKTNGIETGEKRLFEQLRRNGFLIKKDGADFNSPTQKAMELGLFTLTETAIVHHSGITTISKTSRVTGKGQLYFLNYFLNQNGGSNEAN